MRLDELKSYKPQVIGEKYNRQAAVLIPLIEKENGLHVLFQVRSSRLRQQPGDVCFPGGGREKSETACETAVRETCEELLISPKQIKVLGESDRYLNHGRSISAFVGLLENYSCSFSPDEVSEVFTVPLSYFMSTEPDRYEIHADPVFPADFPFDKIEGGKNYRWSRRREEILFWEYEGHVIWGMTACVLSGFIDVLREMKLWEEKRQETNPYRYTD